MDDSGPVSKKRSLYIETELYKKKKGMTTDHGHAILCLKKD